jgi:hypothetical protein
MSIDEPIDMAELGEDEIKKRRPKPFRYIDNEREIQEELEIDKTPQFTLMKVSDEAKITMNEGRLANLENAEKIEGVIKKHEGNRRQNLEDAESYSIN